MATQTPNNMIINATAFDPATDTKYAKPKINASGGKSVNILSPASDQVLNLSTPLLLTWGVGEFVDDKTGRRSYDMGLAVSQGGVCYCGY